MADQEVTTVAGLKAAHDQSAAGDTITLRAGTYYMRRGVEGAYWYMNHSGNNGSPITYRAAPGEAVYLDFSDVIAGASWDQDGDVYSADVSGLAIGDSAVYAFAGGYLCSLATALEQLTTPAAELYSGANLTFDLTFYDSTAKRLHFRSNDVAPVLPGSLRLVGPYSQLLMDASYITLSGLRFRYGYTPVRTSSSTAKAGIVIQDCDIRHAGNGITDHANFTGTIIDRCYFDYCGSPMRYVAGAWSRNNADHCAYLSGAYTVMRDSVIGRACGGAGIHAYANVTGGLYERNVLLGSAYWNALYNGSGGLFRDNIMVNYYPLWRGESIAAYTTGVISVGMATFSTTANLIVEHNYIEGAYGFRYWAPASVMGMRLTNNILRGTSEAACLNNESGVSYTLKSGNTLSPITAPPSGASPLGNVAGITELLDAVPDYENPVPRIRQLARDYVAPWQPWPLPQSKRRVVALMMEF